MIEGYQFIIDLQNTLIPNQPIGKYTFIKWMSNGGLQFRINQSQKKSIPAELLALAYHIKNRNTKIKHKVILDQKWLATNGYTDWCFIEVINFIV